MTTLNDLILSWWRTGVAAAFGSLFGWLASRGLDLDPEAQTAVIVAVTGACITAWQVLVSTLQRKWPIIGILLGSTRQPTYVSPDEREQGGGLRVV